MKTTPNSIYLLLKAPGEVFIGTREEGGQGTNPGPKWRARRGRMTAFPRPLGGRVRRFEPRAVLLVPCQILLPVSGFWPLVLMNQLL